MPLAWKLLLPPLVPNTDGHQSLAAETANAEHVRQGVRGNNAPGLKKGPKKVGPIMTISELFMCPVLKRVCLCLSTVSDHRKEARDSRTFPDFCSHVPSARYPQFEARWLWQLGVKKKQTQLSSGQEGSELMTSCWESFWNLGKNS